MQNFTRPGGEGEGKGEDEGLGEGGHEEMI